MEEIEVIIEKDGSVTIEGKNFVDASCKTATKELEDDLGVSTLVQAKPELQRQVTTRTAAKTVRR